MVAKIIGRRSSGSRRRPERAILVPESEAQAGFEFVGLGKHDGLIAAKGSPGRR